MELGSKITCQILVTKNYFSYEGILENIKSGMLQEIVKRMQIFSPAPVDVSMISISSLSDVRPASDRVETIVGDKPGPFIGIKP